MQRLADCIVSRPCGQGSRHLVQEGYAAVGVGRDHRITDAGEGDAEKLSSLLRAALGEPDRLTEGDDDGAADDVGTEADEVLGRSEAEPRAWLDEQKVTRQIAENHREQSGAITAHPDGDRNR